MAKHYSHRGRKKLQREMAKRQKKLAKLEKRGRLSNGKSAHEKMMERMQKQAADSKPLEFRKIGATSTWFPEIKKADLELLGRGQVVRKGDMELRLDPTQKHPQRLYIRAVQRGHSGHQNATIGIFSVDLEMKTIKKVAFGR